MNLFAAMSMSMHAEYIQRRLWAFLRQLFCIYSENFFGEASELLRTSEKPFTLCIDSADLANNAMPGCMWMDEGLNSLMRSLAQVCRWPGCPIGRQLGSFFVFFFDS